MSDLREYIAARIAIEDRGHTTPCWVWQKWLTEKGYARARLPGCGNGNVRVHRATYEDHIGPIPEGLQIDHLCRVKACVNPHHLEAVTGLENALRSILARGLNLRRMAPGYVPTPKRPHYPLHCPNGHEYTSEELKGTIRGGHRCRACHRATEARTARNRQVRRAAARINQRGVGCIGQRPDQKDTFALHVEGFTK